MNPARRRAHAVTTCFRCRPQAQTHYEKALSALDAADVPADRKSVLERHFRDELRSCEKIAPASTSARTTGAEAARPRKTKARAVTKTGGTAEGMATETGQEATGTTTETTTDAVAEAGSATGEPQEEPAAAAAAAAMAPGATEAENGETARPRTARRNEAFPCFTDACDVVHIEGKGA